MPDRKDFEALSTLDEAMELRKSGMSEEDIAKHFGFEGKNAVSNFREALSTWKLKKRAILADKVRDLIKNQNMSISEAAEALGIKSGEALSVRIWRETAGKDVQYEKND